MHKVRMTFNGQLIEVFSREDVVVIYLLSVCVAVPTNKELEKLEQQLKNLTTGVPGNTDG